MYCTRIQHSTRKLLQIRFWKVKNQLFVFSGIFQRIVMELEDSHWNSIESSLSHIYVVGLENPCLHIKMYYTISCYYSTVETQMGELAELLLLICKRRALILVVSEDKLLFFFFCSSVKRPWFWSYIDVLCRIVPAPRSKNQILLCGIPSGKCPYL